MGEFDVTPKKIDYKHMMIINPWASLTTEGIRQEAFDGVGNPIVDFQYCSQSSLQLGKRLYQMRRGSEDALCFDIRANVSFTLGRGQQAKVPTGVRIAMPSHMGCIMRERSGLAERGVRLHAGTLDADYRGEYFVLISYQPMVNVFEPALVIPDSITVTKGDRIAQMYFTPEDPSLLRWEIVNRVEDMPRSLRGETGFGSSGIGSFVG